MTPAEHYTKAEECIAEVMDGIDLQRRDGGTLDVSTPLALAQVHATLATDGTKRVADGGGLEPYQAEVLVEWWPSASIGEATAVRLLLDAWCSELMERLLALEVVDPTVDLSCPKETP